MYHYPNAKRYLKIDATLGHTWVSQGPFQCEGETYYKIGCWAKTDKRGATLKLQSMTILPSDIGGRDFVISEHSGNGKWEYLSAVGKTNDYGPLFPARIKMEVADGIIA